MLLAVWGHFQAAILSCESGEGGMITHHRLPPSSGCYVTSCFQPHYEGLYTGTVSQKKPFSLKLPFLAHFVT